MTYSREVEGLIAAPHTPVGLADLGSGVTGKVAWKMTDERVAEGALVQRRSASDMRVSLLADRRRPVLIPWPERAKVASR